MTPSVANTGNFRKAASPLPFRPILYTCLLFVVALFGGCLIYESVEYHLTLNPDGKSGTLVIRYSNIESSNDEPAKQKEDYQELMDKWKGDKYLLDRMNEGVYIKKRSLELKKGVLHWEEIGIFPDIGKMNDGISYNDTSHISLGKDEAVVSTNGTVLLSKDSTVVVWPPHTRDFRITVQNKDFHPTSHFAQKFREGLKKK